MFSLNITILLVMLQLVVSESIDNDQKTQQSQKKGMNKDYDHYYVHIIPHTHDDVGWLKNPEEYYYAFRMDIQYAGVFDILDNVIQELLLDKKRRFSYVEMKFFELWWQDQTDETKDLVRGLVNEGRLEFLNAGWSMHDEACPHYEDMIDNMMIGHQFLKREFNGYKPRIGWHIDPFGHSSANAGLFAEMGFDGWFFARLDYEDKANRLNTQQMEFIWRPFYDNLGNRTQIFTHVLYNHYSAPPNLGFDITNQNDPFIDDPLLSTYNADTLSAQFNDWIQQMAQHYITNHLFITFGDDFNYMNARMYFKALDRMINYFDNHFDNVTLMYSTPSMYIDSISKMDVQWPTKYDDMFPYADDVHNYWTGYFTSRANDKEMTRRGSYNFHGSQQLYYKGALNGIMIEEIKKQQMQFMDAMGINQHHDAITGTGKQAVADNYAKLISKSIQENNQIYTQMINLEAQEIYGRVVNLKNWTWCYRDNSTYLDCPIAYYKDQKQRFILASHNPSPVDIYYTSISVPIGKYQVSGYNYHKQKFQQVKSSLLCDDYQLENKQMVDNCQLYLQYTIPATHIGFFTIDYDPDYLHVQDGRLPEGQIIHSKYETLQYVGSLPEYGQVFNLTKKYTNKTYQLAFDIRYYPSSQDDGQNSGVYIFRPEDGVNESFRYTQFEQIDYKQTEIVSEFHMVYKNKSNGAYADVYMRLQNDMPVIEFDVVLGGIPLSDRGQEVTINFRALDIDNNQTFYTDSNGLEMQKRVIGYRESWNWTGEENVTSNYYPISTCISIKDQTKKLQMNVMNSRSQGASVLKNGRIEIMQNRRMYRDDGRGMGEPLNETDEFGQGIVVPAKYYVQLFDWKAEESLQRKVQLKQDYPQQTFYQFNEWISYQQGEKKLNYIKEEIDQILQRSHPSDQFKYYVYAIDANQILIRFENIGDQYDLNGRPNSKGIEINVFEFAKKLYMDANNGRYNVDQMNIKEVDLTANQDYKEMMDRKVRWKTVDDWREWKVEVGRETLYKVILEKQRIRSFRIEYLEDQYEMFLN